MNNSYITHSDEETRALGRALSRLFSQGAVIALHGDLGAGKTTFTQGIADGLGISRHVTSPTFLIQKSYEVSESKMLYHLDLYRLQNEKEAESIGIKELLTTPGQVVVIEWPEKIESLLPQDSYHIYFTYQDDNQREIILKKV